MFGARRTWHRTPTGTLRSFTMEDCQEIIDHPQEAGSERYAVVVCLKDGTTVGLTYYPTLAGQAFEIPAASSGQEVAATGLPAGWRGRTAIAEAPGRPG